MNPIDLAEEIEERYRRYLKTTFYLKDPVLRRSFEEALRSGRLSKGPYIEATPVFKRGTTPSSLFRELLGFDPEPGFLEAVQSERPLYRHQEKAIRSVFEGRNAVVATGTGSGKTEAFLYPILLHLYQEFRAGTLDSGVRALVLYPMNALANDQRDRLGAICERLVEANSAFRFTFGQYIGETPENANDTRRHARDHIADRKPGELVLRSEIRATPPHILLTNYSMLEYLLLRPNDSPLFDLGQARWWTFLVLDEAHQYRGSKGIEMAMLLRRLKQRLREGGCAQSFRCLATSATLVGGSGDTTAVATFGENLFDERFQNDDVILGEVEPIPESSAVSLEYKDYGFVSQALENRSVVSTELIELAGKLDVQIVGNHDCTKIIGSLLQRDYRAAKLRAKLTESPTEAGELADHVFADLPEETRVRALSEFVGLLVRTKDPITDAPLLSARYHLFLRSLEGAFISFSPNRRILLDRRAEGEASALFEVGLCRECGQHYIVGKVVNNKLLEAIRDPGRSDFGATFFLPIEGQIAEDENLDNDVQLYRLCALCGEIRSSGLQLQCAHDAVVFLQEQEASKEREDQVPRCVVCGYQAADPVREVVHGTDGPHAVIATTLYQSLPEKRKKVLAFADGRQEAAFFAWYLEDSYKDILNRNLLRRVVRRQGAHSREGSSLQDLATGLLDVFRERNVFPPATSELQLRREAWLGLYREFLTDEPRISLEGVGVARWLLKWPDWFRVSPVLTKAPWSLSEEQAQSAAFVLLDSMRTDRGVELQSEETVSISWNDLQLQAAQMKFRIGAPRGQYAVRSWNGKTGKRVRFLAKLLSKITSGISSKAVVDLAEETVRAVWETFRQCDENAPTSNDRLLLSIGDARRLNPDWWRLKLVSDNDIVYQCDTCGRIQAVSIHAVCQRHRCPGTLLEMRSSELEPNHYRILYEAELPGSIRVEEHTAQLDKEKAREFQREFREGKIHVLSCSTTFELGVDLGDLDTIFLRNVPPEAFNYAQRVGRSGRRSGYPGFAITYCRRGPHDLYHFADPYRMLSGKVQSPALTLRNEKIVTRHIAAMALSSFFRACAERFATVEKLFGNLMASSGSADFGTFLRKNQPQLEATIRNVVPHDMLGQLGLADGSWISKICGDGSRFAEAEAEVSSDYKTVVNLEQTASSNRDYKTAEWARRRAETIAEEQVPSFLSRKAAIPKYGFPVDVVELDTQRTQQNREAYEVSLQRDLSIAISEFAPTSKLVANKQEWTSYGLKKVAEREWDRRLYKRCTQHNVFLQWKRGDAEPSTPCGDRIPVYAYIIPRFGFVTERDKPKPPKSRPPKVFSTRPYFAGSLATAPETIAMPASFPVMTIKKASPGLMVVLCEGRRGEGFYLCGGCGAGFRTRQNRHKTPQGQDCDGMLEQVSLGQEFVTDVLQLQFEPAPQAAMDIIPFAFSLAYSVVEGAAEVLEVPSVDLSATVAHSENQVVPPIVLYDNVPGGAGLVARLESEDVLRNCLQTALGRVDGSCGCAETASCYGCLRSYRNQFAHQYLQRGPIMQYLTNVLSAWR
jgi:superfamily II DNA/RNA helicase